MSDKDDLIVAQAVSDYENGLPAINVTPGTPIPSEQAVEASLITPTSVGVTDGCSTSNFSANLYQGNFECVYVYIILFNSRYLNTSK